ncbi:hypothetical protein [Adlercreutzia faecimuris]|uniref:4Fe-4S ferredoxin-type domain-containing protein n=1 Tax=Adlercreutzia faecimuris TaxID=2897341 RepID=A0ABS9WEM8_9ACTN|nr:hypothetical protein [Adlercreutzia sp. JBNU-10]MCI2241324.1 hypothetical protein [Adlercreutzia sp. JBNU-10]
MTNYGFYFDAESCIGCHTCQVACKDVHDLPVGTNYRIVRSFCTGAWPAPGLYHLSLSARGCDLCSDLRECGEAPACVTACPMRCLEFGDLDALRRAHEGERLVDHAAPVANADMANPNILMRLKDCMLDPDYDEIII